MNKKLIVISLIIIILGGVGYFVFKGSGNKQTKIIKESTSLPSSSSLSSGQEMTLEEVYRGFKQPEVGDWAEWRVLSDGKEVKTKYVYVGEKVIDGKQAYGFEFSAKFQGKDVASQIWYDKENFTPLKYAVKFNQEVYCLPLNYYENEGEEPQVETPEEYTPEQIKEKFNFKIGTYTTSSGKTIKVVKVYKSDQEVWLSSEIPFGIVKLIDSGEVKTELIDFGTGVTPQISYSEIQNCKTFSLPFNLGF